MGAMENKGLNIFNSKYVLCDEASATDAAIQGVSRVVAHEFVDTLARCISSWLHNRQVPTQLDRQQGNSSRLVSAVPKGGSYSLQV